MPGTEAGTFLFTDLVGSTALSSGLATTEAEALRQIHYSLLRAAVAANDGIEVKTLGDGLMVRFTSPSRALDCAEAMQQGIARHNTRAVALLSVRIGVATGEAIEEDGDYFGDPVIEAARLCAVAQGDQILATDVVRAMARRSGHAFSIERELELKGLPEPVVAWEVTWAPLEEVDPAGIPLPDRLSIVPVSGVVGRAAERAVLSDALKAVSAGDGQRVVLIGGEAGMGKTTLVAAVAREAHRLGAVVLYGRCDEDLVVPYQPFVEALGYFVANTDTSLFDELDPDALGALVRLLPELRRRLPDMAEVRASDPDAERWMLYGAVVSLLRVAAAENPVVLVLDDVHWADSPSLQLLRHLARNPAGRLLVLGTYRDAELSATHVLTETLAAMAREHELTRLGLRGLGDDEVLTLLETAAGQELDEEGVGLAHALHQETDGNPFYVAEVLRHLVETRAIVQDDTGRWVPTVALAEVGLPDSVRQVVGSRVARLGIEASRVLSAAAVVGQEFDLDLVAPMAGIDQDALLDVLDATTSAALTAEVSGRPGRFRFVHALIQHTLYADLGATRQARLHGLAADALEELCGADPGERTGELARHLLAATQPAHTAKAALSARRAGDRALAGLAPDEAIRWYEEALGALLHAPDDAERACCLAGLGEAQRQVGDRAYRETLLEAGQLAQRVGDVDLQARAALANNRGMFSATGVVDAERVAALESVLQSIGSHESATRARLLALLAAERVFDGDYPARRVLADEALAMARRLGDSATLLEILPKYTLAIWVADAVEDMHAVAIEARALSEQAADPVAKFWAISMVYTFMAHGDTDEVHRVIEQLSTLADTVGQPVLRWFETDLRSWAALAAGDVETAESLATLGLQLGNDTRQPDALALYGALLFSIRWHQGRLSEVVGFLGQLADDNPGAPAFRNGQSLALCEAGRDEEARSILEAARVGGFADPNDALLTTSLASWAEVAVHLGDEAASTMLYERLARWPEVVVCTGCTNNGAVAHFLGVLATALDRYETAEAHFDKALLTHEKMAAPFFIARTRLEWGRMLGARRGAGDLDRARLMVQQAQQIASARGYLVVERRAAALLASW